uniref:Coagulation factor V n=1 Tax=Strongyloides papillosus TaxID=174720 RepID=A0A0N5C989_STREA
IVNSGVSTDLHNQKQSPTQSSEDCENECDRSIGSFTYLNNDHILSQRSSSININSDHTTSETVV